MQCCFPLSFPCRTGAFFYDNELDLEKEFLSVVSAINGPNAEPTFSLNPLVKRLKPEDGSVVLQEHGEGQGREGGCEMGTHSDDENSSLFQRAISSIMVSRLFSDQVQRRRAVSRHCGADEANVV